MTATPRGALRLVADGGLRWTTSAPSAVHASRGFCAECGSSLFWDAPGRETISIAAGTLDAPTGLRTVGQIYVADAGDYYDVDPGLVSFAGGSGAG
jgi:hypothetical protein